jgi:hypothetical protein
VASIDEGRRKMAFGMKGIGAAAPDGVAARRA